MIESALSFSPKKHEEEQEQIVCLLSGSKELNICALTPKFSRGERLLLGTCGAWQYPSSTDLLEEDSGKPTRGCRLSVRHSSRPQGTILLDCVPFRNNSFMSK